MILYPAIDLLRGQCVRLQQGDYSKITNYGNPDLYLKNFMKAGAEWVHIVDLDAARTGKPSFNYAFITKMARDTSVKTQVGGGLRDMTSVEFAMDLGINRCVLGTSAMKNRSFTEQALAKYSDKIAIAIDAKDNNVMIDGWISDSHIDTLSFAKMMESIGAKTIIYTDISKDGMLGGPSFETIQILVSETDLDIIASGGISSVEDIDRLKRCGAAGAIIGKALYEQKIDLAECFKHV